MCALKLGVLVDSEAKLSQLRHTVAQTALKIDYCAMVPESGEPGDALLPMDDLERIAELDAWLVDITHAEQAGGAQAILDVLLARADLPVLLCDSSELGADRSERIGWQNRLRQRLQRLIGEVRLAESAAARWVWVLAASTGGPGAVRDFIQALPADLPVGFLYVQHIDEGYSPALVNMISKAGYPADIAAQGSVIEPGRVTIVDPDHRVEVVENGTLVVHDEPWSGPYKPSIDQLTANLARTHGPRSGLMIFSGMGRDGAASCRFIRQGGGQVWAQSPGDCVLDAMPLAALETDCVDFEGTPGELAARFGAMIQEHKATEERKAHESAATHTVR